MQAELSGVLAIDAARLRLTHSASAPTQAALKIALSLLQNKSHVPNVRAKFPKIDPCVSKTVPSFRMCMFRCVDQAAEHEAANGPRILRWNRAGTAAARVEAAGPKTRPLTVKTCQNCQSFVDVQGAVASGELSSIGEVRIQGAKLNPAVAGKPRSVTLTLAHGDGGVDIGAVSAELASFVGVDATALDVWPPPLAPSASTVVQVAVLGGSTADVDRLIEVVDSNNLVTVSQSVAVDKGSLIVALSADGDSILPAEVPAMALTSYTTQCIYVVRCMCMQGGIDDTGPRRALAGSIECSIECSIQCSIEWSVECSIECSIKHSVQIPAKAVRIAIPSGTSLLNVALDVPYDAIGLQAALVESFGTGDFEDILGYGYPPTPVLSNPSNCLKTNVLTCSILAVYDPTMPSAVLSLGRLDAEVADLALLQSAIANDLGISKSAVRITAAHAGMATRPPTGSVKELGMLPLQVRRCLVKLVKVVENGMSICR